MTFHIGVFHIKLENEIAFSDESLEDYPETEDFIPFALENEKKIGLISIFEGIEINRRKCYFGS